MEVLELLNMVDSTASLIIAVWVINQGLAFTREQRNQTIELTNSVLKELASNNNELMNLVFGLCGQGRMPTEAEQKKV